MRVRSKSEGALLDLDLELGSEDSEIGEEWEIEEESKSIGWDDLPRRRKVWYIVSAISVVSAIPFSVNLLDQHIWYLPIVGLSSFGTYIFLVMYLSYWRIDPLPCKLRRSEKQLFESAFVGVCSGWTYYDRDRDLLTSALVLVLFFNVIPLLNMWWCFENICFWDCGLIFAIDSALLYVRNRGIFVFTSVAGACVALQLIKDPFRQYISMKFKRRNL